MVGLPEDKKKSEDTFSRFHTIHEHADWRAPRHGTLVLVHPESLAWRPTCSCVGGSAWSTGIKQHVVAVAETVGEMPYIICDLPLS